MRTWSKRPAQPHSNYFFLDEHGFDDIRALGDPMANPPVSKCIAYAMAACAALAVAAFSFAAHAQGAKRNIPVTDRLRPELEPQGARLGGFLLYPKLGVEERFVDNIFSTDDDTQNDLITILHPSFRLNSNWNRHALNFSGTASVARHAKNGAEDYEDFRIGTNGRIDIVRDTFLTAAFSYSVSHEDRGSLDDVNGAEPTNFTVLLPTVGFSHRFGRFNLNTVGTLRRFDYDDVSAAGGATINNDDRDRDEWEGVVRLGYEIIPEYEAFIRGSVKRVDYDTPSDGQTFNRDGNGFKIGAGTAIDFTGVVFGDVLAEYLYRDFDATAFDTITGPRLVGRITWNVTPLTSIKGALRAGIEETTVTQSGSFASGSFDTQADVSIDHELLRNLLLGAKASIRNKDFKGIDRTDNDIGFGISVKYMANRNFYLLAGYDHRRHDSDIDGEDFVINAFSIRLDLQF